jgi:hypothetical protein
MLQSSHLLSVKSYVHYVAVKSYIVAVKLYMNEYECVLLLSRGYDFLFITHLNTYD